MAIAIVLATGACASDAAPTVSPSAVATILPTAAAATAGTTPTASPLPAPGHELYGFVPYWEMDDTIAAHLATTPLSTIGLFSVTHTGKGVLNPRTKGYAKVTGDVGRTIIREAHERGTRVELVYTTFGRAKNTKLFENAGLQGSVIAALVALAGDLGVDGINVDVEGLDPMLVPAYGSFVGALRDAVVAADAGDRVSVATGAGPLGAAMAAAATTEGADRVFLMGYDYRTPGSSPGATSPLENRDGSGRLSLRWSLDMYDALGVPADRLLLGLPLYGITWPVAGPEIGAPETGRGAAWILRRHLDVLTDPTLVPERDETEVVEVYALPAPAPSAPIASTGVPSAPGASASASASADSVPAWSAIYVDSPDTLTRKLGLSEERGLAGAGFWAIGYERGLPGYTQAMRDYVARGATP